MFSAFIPHLAEGRGFPAEKVKKDEAVTTHNNCGNKNLEKKNI